MLPTALLVLVGSAVGLQQSAVLPVARVRSSSRASLPSAAAAELAKSTRLLELIENTDRGIGASSELRAEIGAVISGLESSWEGTDAFAEPARSQLLRRCEVAYVGQASSKAANAAGGKYRGRLGRVLFRTEALFQHVLPGDVAVNVIQFKLFGLIPGAAVLPGFVFDYVVFVS